MKNLICLCVVAAAMTLTATDAYARKCCAKTKKSCCAQTSTCNTGCNTGCQVAAAPCCQTAAPCQTANNCCKTRTKACCNTAPACAVTTCGTACGAAPVVAKPYEDVKPPVAAEAAPAPAPEAK